MSRPRFRKTDPAPATRTTALDKVLQDLTGIDRPAYFVIGCSPTKAEVLVRLALPADEDDSWEELAYTRRDQAAICFPAFEQVRLYRRLPNGKLWDVTNL